MPTELDAASTRDARVIAQQCLAMRLRRLNRWLTRTYDEALRPLGLTASQLNVLVVIRLMGPVAAAAVARELGLEKSTLSRNLRLMVDSGWVTPGRELALTPAGARLLRDVFPVWQEVQKVARTALGDEALDLLDGLRTR